MQGWIPQTNSDPSSQTKINLFVSKKGLKFSYEKNAFESRHRKSHHIIKTMKTMNWLRKWIKILLHIFISSLSLFKNGNHR